MKFNFISLFPEFIESALAFGVIGKAIKKNIISYQLVNPRDFATDNHRTVDDVAYGGIDGMVMRAEVLQKAFDFLGQGASSPDKKSKTYFLSPQGKTFNQNQVSILTEYQEISFICGRYAGIDNRFLIKNQIEEISIGDFVLSGGELPALVIMDVISRQIPGVLGNADSPINDSFNKNLLEAPSFTRPSQWQGLEVPEILLSGNHAKIENWKERLALLVTLKKRPDLLKEFLSIQKMDRGNGQVITLKELVEFYKKMPEKEKIVCGIQNMIFPQE